VGCVLHFEVCRKLMLMPCWAYTLGCCVALPAEGRCWQHCGSAGACRWVAVQDPRLFVCITTAWTSVELAARLKRLVPAAPHHSRTQLLHRSSSSYTALHWCFHTAGAAGRRPRSDRRCRRSNPLQPRRSRRDRAAHHACDSLLPRTNRRGAAAAVDRAASGKHYRGRCESSRAAGSRAVAGWGPV
jgi:hypothetical protein